MLSVTLAGVGAGRELLQRRISRVAWAHKDGVGKVQHRLAGRWLVVVEVSVVSHQHTLVVG